MNSTDKNIKMMGVIKMSVMEWDKRLELGITDMDNQHKVLLDLMNRLYDKDQSDFDQQIEIINKLYFKTIEHFSIEEKMLESIQYDDLVTHKKIHHDMLLNFERHKREILQKKEIGMKFYMFLTYWLRSHIIGIDRQYVNFIKNKAA